MLYWEYQGKPLNYRLVLRLNVKVFGGPDVEHVVQEARKESLSDYAYSRNSGPRHSVPDFP